MVRSFTPQKFKSNILVNTNYPPQQFLLGEGGGGPPIADDEIFEETIGSFNHLKYEEEVGVDGFVLIQESTPAFDFLNAIVITASGTPEANLHDENPATLCGLTQLGGTREWILDLQSNKPRPLKANIHLQRTGGLAGLIVELEYSSVSDSGPWTLGDAISPTFGNEGDFVLDSGTPTFRYCRLFVTDFITSGTADGYMGTVNV